MDGAALDNAVYIAGPPVSAWLRQELSAVTGYAFGTDPPPSGTADPKSPVVYVGARLPLGPAADIVAWFHSVNAGVDAVLRDGTWPSHVLLTRTVGAMGRRIGEYVLGWMLAEYQHVHTFAHQQENREWHQVRPNWLVGELALVFGTGRIGTAVAELLRACGLRVVGVSRSGRPAPGFDRVVDRQGAQRELPSARWLVATLPLTPETREYFDAGLFASCKDACFVNVGRGGSVEYSALRDALRTGRLRRAVLDVLPDEPPPPGADHWTLPRTTITPHISGPTQDSDVVADFRQCWQAIRAGRRPDLAVDPGLGY